MDPERLHAEYSARQEFEHALINRRVTWLLTSQTILFAAFGLGLDGGSTQLSTFSLVVAWSGLFSSVFLLMGIFAGALAKFRSWRDYLDLEKLINVDQSRSPVEQKIIELRREWGVRTRITKLGLVPDLLLPLLFLVAWAVIVTCAR